MSLAVFAHGQIPADNLESVHLFDNGDLTDTVFTNHFTQVGSALTTVPDRAFTVDGAILLNGDHIRRSGTSKGDLSYSFWVKTSLNNGTRTTIMDQSKRTTDAGTPTEGGLYFYIQNGNIGVAANGGFGYQSGNGTTAQYRSGYTDWLYVDGSIDVSDNDWHHIVVVVDHTLTPGRFRIGSYSYSVYIDGVFDNQDLVSVVPISGTEANFLHELNLASDITAVSFGNNEAQNLTNRYTDAIDEFRIYNRLLTLAEIRDLSVDGVCSGPTVVDIGAITNQSVELSWNSNGLSTSWDIGYLEDGAGQSAIQMINGLTTPSHLLTNLTPGTDYNIFIRSDCGNGRFRLL